MKKMGFRFLLGGLLTMIGNWVGDDRSIKIWLVEVTGGFLSVVTLGMVMYLLGVIQLA